MSAEEKMKLLQEKNKPISLSSFRDLLHDYDKEEISMSKIVEELNLAAITWHLSQLSSTPAVEDVEALAEKVHESWHKEKAKHGFHPPIDCPKKPSYPVIGSEDFNDMATNKHCDKCHPDMRPYNELPDNVKEYDRVTVRTVLKAQKELVNL